MKNYRGRTVVVLRWHEKIKPYNVTGWLHWMTHFTPKLLQDMYVCTTSSSWRKMSKTYFKPGMMYTYNYWKYHTQATLHECEGHRLEPKRINDQNVFCKHSFTNETTVHNVDHNILRIVWKRNQSVTRCTMMKHNHARVGYVYVFNAHRMFRK